MKSYFFAPSYDSSYHSFEIDLSEWEKLCTANFGKPRPCPYGIWTGDAFYYEIYKKDDRLALYWRNGGGEGCFVCQDKDNRTEFSLLSHIAGLENENIRWDFCNFLWETATKTALAAAASERQRIYQNFIDGKLVKKKVYGKNQYIVKIKP